MVGGRKCGSMRLEGEMGSVIIVSSEARGGGWVSNYSEAR